MSFAELGLREELCALAENELHWSLPKAVQVEAIPMLLGGRDLCVASRTGTGKTGAFALPLVQLCVEAATADIKTTVEKARLSWDTEQCRVENDGAVLESTSRKKWGSAKAQQRVHHGVWCYEVRIEAKGIVRVGWSSSMASRDLGKDCRGYGFGGTGVKVHGGEYTKYGSAFGNVGDIIGTTLNFKTGTISYRLNGADLGVAFENLPAVELGPALCVKEARVRFASAEVDVQYKSEHGVSYWEEAFAMTEKRAEEGPIAIVVEPNAELAAQVYNFIRKVAAREKDVNVGLCAKGYREKRGPINGGIIVGTAGKMASLMDAGELCLRRVKVLIADEADALAAMASTDLIRIHCAAKVRPQTAFFSATIDSDPLRRLSSRLQRFPEWVKLDQSSVPSRIRALVIVLEGEEGVDSAPSVLTDSVHAEGDDGDGAVGRSKRVKVERLQRLRQLLDVWGITRAMLFVRTHLDAEILQQFLSSEGYAAVERAKRDALSEFRSGAIQFLICTDGAERGLDVDDLDVVISLHMPTSAEKLIHRIGRVGKEKVRQTKRRKGKNGAVLAPIVPVPFAFAKARDDRNANETERHLCPRVLREEWPKRNSLHLCFQTGRARLVSPLWKIFPHLSKPRNLHRLVERDRAPRKRRIQTRRSHRTHNPSTVWRKLHLHPRN